jgi:hypothetical protein
MHQSYVMKTILILTILLILTGIAVSCRSVPSSESDIHFYNFNQEKGDMSPSNNQPTNQAPSYSNEPDEYTRNVIVTEQNSIFSIGIPANHTEKTEVTAEKPVDFWFEYVPDDLQLKINNQLAPRDPTKWETKLGYMEHVTKFNYEAKNGSSGIMSYNLYIIPSTEGESVPVKVVQHYNPN